MPNALKGHYLSTCNPCLQGALHLVRSQLSQQLQANVLKCGHTQALLKTCQSMSCLHNFLHWLSSKTVATTCHHNSFSLSTSSIDHFSLKSPWLYTFQHLLLTLIYFPIADTHSFTQFFVAFELFLWNTWCFDLNLHILYHSTLLLNNLVNIGSQSIPTKCILSEDQTQNSRSLLNPSKWILNCFPKRKSKTNSIFSHPAALSTGSATMKSIIVYPVSQMILYSLLYLSPISLGHQVLVTILL